MKRKLLLGAFAIAIVCVGAVGVSNFSQGKNIANDSFTLENVEALSDPDAGVVITCGSGHSGKCFRKGYDLKFCGEYSYYECTYTGYTFDYCWKPC